MRRAAVPAIAVLALSWLVILELGPWADERISDLPVYRAVAPPVLHGGMPYRSFLFEYPPLAAPVIAAPGLLGTGADAYRLAFAGLMLAVAAAVLVLTGLLAERTGGDARRAMLAVALAPLLTGAMLRTHFDLAPVALTLGALALLSRGRPRLGLAVLGLGVMTKGFPLVVAPVALAWLVARGERRAALEAAAALLAVVALVSGAALAVSPSGAIEAVRFHAERPVQVESVPAVAILALEAVGRGEAQSVKSYGSDGLLHEADDVVSAVSGATLGGVVGLFALGAARSAEGGRPDARRLVLASLAALAAFATLGKVLSPQFMVWTVPLMALAVAWRMYALAVAVSLAIGLTLVEFPSRYLDLVAREPLPVGVVVVRNLLLLSVLVLAVRALGLGRLSAPAGAPARSRWPDRRRPPRRPRH